MATPKKIRRRRVVSKADVVETTPIKPGAKNPGEKKPVKILERGVIMVSRHFPRGEETMEFTDLEVQTFEVEPAHVQAKYGLTINMKNYESARVDVSVTLPCYVEEVDPAFKKAFAIAEKYVQEQAAEAVAARDN